MVGPPSLLATHPRPQPPLRLVDSLDFPPSQRTAPPLLRRQRWVACLVPRNQKRPEHRRLFPQLLAVPPLEQPVGVGCLESPPQTRMLRTLKRRRTPHLPLPQTYSDLPRMAIKKMGLPLVPRRQLVAWADFSVSQPRRRMHPRVIIPLFFILFLLLWLIRCQLVPLPLRMTNAKLLGLRPL